MGLNDTFRKIQEAFARDFTEAALRSVIILWALFVIFLALNVKNKFLLAGILSYELLP